MPIVSFEPVTRRGMRLMISLYGLSESGKTQSALLLAAGIEPDPSKRAMLDTEGGQRGRMYGDKVPGGYVYANLSPPFTPERYVEAISDAEAAGINVLVIDSVSHAWFAEGGILDMVENATDKNDMAKWNKPKRRLGKMSRRIFSSNMHLILCSRARQPLIDNGADVKPRYTPGPITPVQDKNLRYDMTIMALMTGRGRFKIEDPEGKCPGDLLELFQKTEVMGIELGKKIGTWAEADYCLSPEQRKLEVDAQENAEGGVDHFREWWKKLSKVQQDFLRTRTGNLESIARAADEEKKRLAEEERQNGNSLEAPFTAGAAAAVSDAATRAMTDLKACQSLAEFENVWSALPVDVCRELGAPFHDQCKADLAAKESGADKQGRML